MFKHKISTAYRVIFRDAQSQSGLEILRSRLPYLTMIHAALDTSHQVFGPGKTIRRPQIRTDSRRFAPGKVDHYGARGLVCTQAAVLAAVHQVK